MDFFEHQPAWAAGPEQATDSYRHKVDGAVDQTIARAIRDATQTADAALQREAAAWLWICCPDIAEQVELPELHYDTLPTLAAGYVTGEADTPNPSLA
jgi:hypothetical protein